MPNKTQNVCFDNVQEQCYLRGAEMRFSLKACRVNANLSLEEAANMLEITNDCLKRLEEDTDYLKKADVLLIDRICRLYGITAEEIKL